MTIYFTYRLQLNKDKQLDWWYAVVGHMESCNEKQNFCRCGYSDTLVLEFKQYNEGSSMGRVKLLRNEKEYEEATGCYGGIRKLQSEEIQRWEKLLPLYNQTPVFIP
ncbi:uncharacterized protein HKW66_Vig0047890 [Vigna angularis]|uniref:Uncharacterized protein n=1 Tax=Phaseolus angularis TaxID=3914 RepID=A0A8T0L0W2_PHAAN|nr:uncharacterized protein HKW66_Vig0047890 [Vigna angularis]